MDKNTLVSFETIPELPVKAAEGLYKGLLMILDEKNELSKSQSKNIDYVI